MSIGALLPASQMLPSFLVSIAVFPMRCAANYANDGSLMQGNTRISGNTINGPLKNMPVTVVVGQRAHVPRAIKRKHMIGEEPMYQKGAILLCALGLILKHLLAGLENFVRPQLLDWSIGKPIAKCTSAVCCLLAARTSQCWQKTAGELPI